MKFCSLKNHDRINMAINILIHVTILWTFLTIFFSFVVAPLIQNAFDTEIRHAINESVKNMVNSQQMSPTERKFLTGFRDSTVHATLMRYYSQPEPVRVEHNKWLLRCAWIAVGILVLATTLMVITSAALCNDVPLGQFISENIILFMGIGAVEGLFFYFIAMNYVPIPPSLVAKTIIQYLQRI